MSKHKIGLIIWVILALVLEAPALFMGYGVLLGHTYSSNQVLAAMTMGLLGIPAIIGVCISWATL